MDSKPQGSRQKPDATTESARKPVMQQHAPSGSTSSTIQPRTENAARKLETPDQVKAALIQEAERRGSKWRPGSGGKPPGWLDEVLGFSRPRVGSRTAGEAAPQQEAASAASVTPQASPLPPFTEAQVAAMFGGGLRMVMEGISAVADPFRLDDPQILDSHLADWARMSTTWINENRQHFSSGFFAALGTFNLLAPRAYKGVQRYKAAKAQEAMRQRGAGPTAPPAAGGTAT